jgi:hypothetical protein
MNTVIQIIEDLATLYMLVLCIAATKSIFTNDRTPSPFGLIGMLWRVEILEKEK